MQGRLWRPPPQQSAGRVITEAVRGRQQRQQTKTITAGRGFDDCCETGRVVSVLGIEVDGDLLRSWAGWVAPELQPFLSQPWAAPAGGAAALADVSAQLRDTYTLWNVDRSLVVVWLDEVAFFDMPRSQRAALVRSQVNLGRGAAPTVRRWLDLVDPAAVTSQADGHRFVWWPSLIRSDPERILARVVETDNHPMHARLSPSQHRDVTATTWNDCATVLPGAQTLAGTFPRGSGPNCFGTVMAAAGVAGAADQRMLQAPFLDWLSACCRPGGTDVEPGTVLVWSDQELKPVHAAVTIGDGWVLEKPSQCWWTPRSVVNVGQAIRASRSRGVRLRRYRCV